MEQLIFWLQVSKNVKYNDIILVKTKDKFEYLIGMIILDEIGYKKFIKFNETENKLYDLSRIDIILNFREEHKLYEVDIP